MPPTGHPGGVDQGRGPLRGRRPRPAFRTTRHVEYRRLRAESGIPEDDTGAAAVMLADVLDGVPSPTVRGPGGTSSP